MNTTRLVHCRSFWSAPTTKFMCIECQQWRYDRFNKFHGNSYFQTEKLSFSSHFPRSKTRISSPKCYCYRLYVLIVWLTSRVWWESTVWKAQRCSYIELEWEECHVNRNSRSHLFVTHSYYMHIWGALNDIWYTKS